MKIGIMTIILFFFAGIIGLLGILLAIYKAILMMEGMM